MILWLTRNGHTSSLSLPIKSSSGCAWRRPPPVLWTWPSPRSIFSWSPWLCPRLGEWGWDEKVNTSFCKVSWGSDPSLLSWLFQTSGSKDKPDRSWDSTGVGAASILALAGLQLCSSRIINTLIYSAFQVNLLLSCFWWVISLWTEHLFQDGVMLFLLIILT